MWKYESGYRYSWSNLLPRSLLPNSSRPSLKICMYASEVIFHLIRKNMRIVCLRVKVFRRWVMDTLSRLSWTTLKKPPLFERMLWRRFALREGSVRKINRVLCYMTEFEWPWIAEDGDESRRRLRRPNKPTQKWRECDDTRSPSSTKRLSVKAVGNTFKQ